MITLFLVLIKQQIANLIIFTQPLSTERLSLSGVGRSSPSCRICQSSRRSVQELGELLDSPCHCRGTLGFVHKHCIETWLRVRKQDTCELCHFKFETRWRYKPFREVGRGFSLCCIFIVKIVRN